MPTNVLSQHNDIGLRKKVGFLSLPSIYAERSKQVRTIETHMSWVFLTDKYAYKLKKPVRYDFLDFSTIEARHYDCQAEIRLNRRLAPNVYLGIVPLTIDDQENLHLDGSGQAVDWLVKMRRLPTELMLDQLIRTHMAQENDVGKVARLLARFYMNSVPIDLTAAKYQYGLQDKIKDNLNGLLAPEFGLSTVQVERIHQSQLDFLEQQSELFTRRVTEGRIIEGHGDLRPEHICLEQEPVIIDCLEFNREFRILDPVDELAFLALECERLGAPFIGEILFAEYIAATADQPPQPLIHYHKSYRACLRARFTIWHIREPEVRDPDHWRHLAQVYLQLAEKYISLCC